MSAPPVLPSVSVPAGHGKHAAAPVALPVALYVLAGHAVQPTKRQSCPCIRDRGKRNGTYARTRCRCLARTSPVHTLQHVEPRYYPSHNFKRTHTDVRMQAFTSVLPVTPAVSVPLGQALHCALLTPLYVLATHAIAPVASERCPKARNAALLTYQCRRRHSRWPCQHRTLDTPPHVLSAVPCAVPCCETDHVPEQMSATPRVDAPAPHAASGQAPVSQMRSL